MHQDIKNFSQLLGTDNIDLEVSITIKIHGLVAGIVEFNGNRCYEGTNNFTVDLREDCILSSVITHYDEGTSAIEIIDLTINGYNVIPKYQHHSSSGNGYHDFIGKWEYTIDQPFYVWYHKISGQGWIA